MMMKAVECVKMKMSSQHRDVTHTDIADDEVIRAYVKHDDDGEDGRADG